MWRTFHPLKLFSLHLCIAAFAANPVVAEVLPVPIGDIIIPSCPLARPPYNASSNLSAPVGIAILYSSLKSASIFSNNCFPSSLCSLTSMAFCILSTISSYLLKFPFFTMSSTSLSVLIRFCCLKNFPHVSCMISKEPTFISYNSFKVDISVFWVISSETFALTSIFMSVYVGTISTSAYLSFMNPTIRLKCSFVNLFWSNTGYISEKKFWSSIKLFTSCFW